MVDYEKPTERPAIGVFYSFDHVRFWVGNAKQAASYYTSRMGFEYIAYQVSHHRDSPKYRDLRPAAVTGAPTLFAMERSSMPSRAP